MTPTVNTELYERIEPYIAEPSSEEGRAAIHAEDETHVSEVWEDGEVTYTKNGDLYQARRLHQNQPPWLPRSEVLWTVPDGRDHKRMVITDDQALTEMAKYMVENDLGPNHLDYYLPDDWEPDTEATA